MLEKLYQWVKIHCEKQKVPRTRRNDRDNVHDICKLTEAEFPGRHRDGGSKVLMGGGGLNYCYSTWSDEGATHSRGFRGDVPPEKF